MNVVKTKTIYDQFGENVLREGVKDEKGSNLNFNLTYMIIDFKGGYVY